MIENPQRFSGKRVIVTGAAGGVGGKLVEMFRDEGATVVGTDVVAGDGIVATDLRDEQAIESFAAAAVEDAGGGGGEEEDEVGDAEVEDAEVIGVSIAVIDLTAPTPDWAAPMKALRGLVAAASWARAPLML